MRIRTGIRRTTTQMLSNSRRRAGLNTRRASVLGSSQKNGTIASRLSVLNANSIQSTATARAGFERLQKSAASLAEQMALLAEKAEDPEKEIGSTAANMVENFNTTLKYLQQNSSVLNDYYRQSMKEIAASNKSELSEIGISVGTDGSLSVDKAKLAEADREKVKKILGTEGTFAKRVNSVASRVADNARVNVETASSRYNSAGNIANSYMSKYNFRG